MATVKKRKSETAGIPYAVAASRQQFPKTGKAEIAFVGRSNVGKSTLVNALAKRKNLARTSKTPGRTRQVFFYEVGPSLYFVDLPGYGYAAAPHGERRSLSQVSDDYFRSGRPIALTLVLIDIRRGFGEDDRRMVDYLRQRQIPWQVVLTKADKLSRQAALLAVQRLTEALEESDPAMVCQVGPPIAVSAGLNPADEQMKRLQALINDRAGQVVLPI